MANDAVQLEFLLAGLRDTSGNPLNGGKIYTYSAGTTTNKTMWTDADKTTAATNPIILDSNGQAEIFADGLYDVTVKDSDDVTLYTWEYLEFQKGFRSTNETITGVKTFSDGILTDTVGEITGAAGVIIDGVKCKDNDVYVDAVEEKTSGAGVIIDTSGSVSVLVKDGVVFTDTITEKTTATGVTIEGTLLKDSAIVSPNIDTINEETAANGVTVDGLSIKDSKLNTADSVETVHITNLNVTTAKINNSAITQGKLSTAMSAVSASAVAFTNVTLPGGEYGFYPQVKMDSVSNTGWGGIILKDDASFAGWTTYVTNIALKGGGSVTSAQQRYIQASPPYDLGNGNIPLFIFAMINRSTGKVEATYIAEDPPWAHNGPKRINPHRVIDRGGKKYLRQKQRPWSHAEAKTDRIKLAENMTVIKDTAVVEVELTQSIKNAGMVDIPHPFASLDPSTHAVVLLDPVSSLCEDLHKLTQEADDGTTEVSELLYAGRIKFGNTAIKGLITPPGVIGVKMRLG